MRATMAIIGIIILIIGGAGILTGGRREEENSRGLEIMEDALKRAGGAAEISCTGLRGAALRQAPSPSKTFSRPSRKRLESLSISKSTVWMKSQGAAALRNHGIPFLYRVDGRKSGVGFSVSSPETNDVCEAISRVSQGLAGYTAGEISTFTLKGTIYRRSDQAAMASITEQIMGGTMRGGAAAEKYGGRNSLNVLGGVSPYFPPGQN